ncbi:hypothetical protein LSM04_001825 [Trypanosoma melophagium]|uniref:uncharacterized protein n=1 Tax=Trypanosoma melophagium TaxID=715481 RepID=UPI00351A89B4|nr:hypothetical protein LSM04_001825 [Trypanosoma melophagium]
MLLESPGVVYQKSYMSSDPIHNSIKDRYKQLFDITCPLEKQVLMETFPKSLTLPIHTLPSPSLIPYTKADNVAQGACEVHNPIISFNGDSSWKLARFQCNNDVLICIGNNAFIERVHHIFSCTSPHSFLMESEKIVSCFFYSYDITGNRNINHVKNDEPCWGNTTKVHHLLRGVLLVLLLSLSSLFTRMTLDNSVSECKPTNAPQLLRHVVYCRVGGYRWFEIPLPMFVEDLG